MSKHDDSVHEGTSDEKVEHSSQPSPIITSSSSMNDLSLVTPHSPLTPVKKKRIYRKRKQKPVRLNFESTNDSITSLATGGLISFSGLLQTVQGIKQPPAPVVPQQLPVKRSREWGVFCFENATDKSVYWGIKGLHVKWNLDYVPQIISSPFGSGDSKNTYNFYYNLSGRRNSTFSPSSPRGHNITPYIKRHSSSGGGAWGNIVRYKLKPNSFCMGYYPLHPFSNHFILLIELHHNDVPQENVKKEAPSNPFPPTQTAIDGIDDTHPPFYHPSKPQRPIVCKSFLIEHKHKHDVIISARVQKSLFLFSDYQSLSVEPITYRFFPTYKPCEVGPQIKLNHNISYDNLRTISNNRKIPSSPIQAVTTFSATPNTSNATAAVAASESNDISNVNGSISLYEEHNVKSLRNNIMFYLLYLHKLRRHANLLVIVDDEYSLQDDLCDMEDMNALYNYLMRSILRSDVISEECKGDRDALCDWFKQCVKLVNILSNSEIKRYVLKFSDNNADRSLQLYRYNRSCSHSSSMDLLLDSIVEEEEETLVSSEPWSHIEGDIDGIIVLSTMESKIPNELCYRLRSLEGFPTLFVFYGLEKCTDIYEAIRQKVSKDTTVLVLTLLRRRRVMIF